jgi:PAS domain S-box-containing protein
MIQQYINAIEQNNIISKTDTDGIITFVNDEFCKISGYSREELIGKNHNIVRDPSVDASKFQLLWNTINNKKTYKSTVRNIAKNGTVFHVNTTVIPILDENGDIEEFIAIRFDVTQEVVLKKELEKKELELEELNLTLERRVNDQTKELQLLNETLEQRVSDEINKNQQKQKVMFWQSRLASLGQMLANIAHQWRQPLTELNLTIFNMKKSSSNNQIEEVQEFYTQSKEIIKNMSNTIDDFTNFFNPTKEKNLFSLSNSIKEAIQISERIIKEEHIFIKTDFEDIKMLGISNELTQIIINLIQNSKDAFLSNKIGQKEIKIVTKKSINFAIVEVTDNAGGIKDENLEKVFEPYFTTKHKSSGTGLGLFMSKMICEQAFNGSIEFQNNDAGVIFTIKIPLEKEKN